MFPQRTTNTKSSLNHEEFMIGLYIIYLSSILKNTNDYSSNALILKYSFLVIYEYMFKYIVDAFFSLNSKMHINKVALCLATDQWMKTWKANKYATKVVAHHCEM